MKKKFRPPPGYLGPPRRMPPPPQITPIYLPPLTHTMTNGASVIHHFRPKPPQRRY